MQLNKDEADRKNYPVKIYRKGSIKPFIVGTVYALNRTHACKIFDKEHGEYQTPLFTVDIGIKPF